MVAADNGTSTDNLYAALDSKCTVIPKYMRKQFISFCIYGMEKLVTVVQFASQLCAYTTYLLLFPVPLCGYHCFSDLFECAERHGIPEQSMRKQQHCCMFH